jgi:acetyl-CoA C-acetyltransferase
MTPDRLRDRYRFIQVRRTDDILEVTIDRPDVRNAVHRDANVELEEVFDHFFDDDRLRVAILTGAGDKAFCAGFDLVHSVEGDPLEFGPTGMGGVISRSGMDKPVIAAVNGFAMGGGFEIALACHLVVADARAQFALSEVKHGLVAGAGGIVRAAQKLPPAIATELILTGRRMGAEEAARLGVVNRVAAPGRALDGARELAREILEGAPNAVRTSLRILEAVESMPDLQDAVSYSMAVALDVLRTDEAREGMRAFADKRPPRWAAVQ